MCNSFRRRKRITTRYSCSWDFGSCIDSFLGWLDLRIRPIFQYGRSIRGCTNKNKHFIMSRVACRTYCGYCVRNLRFSFNVVQLIHRLLCDHTLMPADKVVDLFELAVEKLNLEGDAIQKSAAVALSAVWKKILVRGVIHFYSTVAHTPRPPNRNRAWTYLEQRTNTLFWYKLICALPFPQLLFIDTSPSLTLYTCLSLLLIASVQSCS